MRRRVSRGWRRAQRVDEGYPLETMTDSRMIHADSSVPNALRAFAAKVDIQPDMASDALRYRSGVLNTRSVIRF